MSRFLAFHLHPDVWLVMAGLGVGYWWAISRLRVQLAAPPVSRRMIVWWYSGLVLMWAAAEWPVHDLAEHFSYGIHMTEHLVFTLACAPMLLLGMPGWLLRWLVVDRPWYQPVRWLCRPVPALALNAVVLIGSHWPAVVNRTTHDEWFHFAMHCVIFGAALALFLPVINRIPEMPRLSKPTAILYLFLQGFAPIGPTLWLIFAGTPLYKAYLPGLAYLGWSPTGDQEVAGSLMGAVTPVVLWVIMGYLFFSWYGEEQRMDRLERSLQPTAVTPSGTIAPPLPAR